MYDASLGICVFHMQVQTHCDDIARNTNLRINTRTCTPRATISFSFVPNFSIYPYARSQLPNPLPDPSNICTLPSQFPSGSALFAFFPTANRQTGTSIQSLCAPASQTNELVDARRRRVEVEEEEEKGNEERRKKKTRHMHRKYSFRVRSEEFVSDDSVGIRRFPLASLILASLAITQIRAIFARAGGGSMKARFDAQSLYETSL